MKRKTIKLCLELTIATEKWWILFAYRSPNTHKEEFFDEISVSFNKILGKYHNVILASDFNIFELTLSWWRPLSYRNQSIDLWSKSTEWFLYITASVMKGLRLCLDSSKNHLSLIWKIYLPRQTFLKNRTVSNRRIALFLTWY